MGRKIKTFSEDYYLEFDEGAFDHWCVYLKQPGLIRRAPTDIEVFSELLQFGVLYGGLRIYTSFIEIYDKTEASINSNVLARITEIAKQFENNSLNIDRVLTTLYGGMIAEENKSRAILKKKIKRLGVHQVLIEERTPHFAANFSRNRKAEELILECKVRGF